MKIVQSIGLTFGLLAILTFIFASQQLNNVDVEVIGVGILGIAYSLVIFPCIIIYAFTGAASSIVIYRNKGRYSPFINNNLWRYIYYANISIFILFIMLFFIFPISFFLIIQILNW